MPAVRAMVLNAVREPLEAADLPAPEPGPGEIRVAVRACGVCRTDLHLVDGELPDPKLPVVPGHQVVGVVEGAGEGAGRFRTGDRIGILDNDGNVHVKEGPLNALWHEQD